MMEISIRETLLLRMNPLGIYTLAFLEKIFAIRNFQNLTITNERSWTLRYLIVSATVLVHLSCAIHLSGNYNLKRRETPLYEDFFSVAAYGIILWIMIIFVTKLPFVNSVCAMNLNEEEEEEYATIVPTNLNGRRKLLIPRMNFR